MNLAEASAMPSFGSPPDARSGSARRNTNSSANAASPIDASNSAVESVRGETASGINATRARNNVAAKTMLRSPLVIISLRGVAAGPAAGPSKKRFRAAHHHAPQRTAPGKGGETTPPATSQTRGGAAHPKTK